MTFSYKNFKNKAIKSLILEVFQETGEVVELDEILYDGVRWDSKDSEFVKRLDIPIKKFRMGVELLLLELESREKAKELEVLKLLKNSKKTNFLRDVLKKAIQGTDSLDVKEANLNLTKLAAKQTELRKKLKSR